MLAQSLVGYLNRAKGFLVILVILLLVWYYVVPVTISSLLIPGLASVLEVFLLQGPALVSNLWPTLYEIALGFAAAAIVGVAMGAVLAQIKPVRDALYPFLVIIYSTPKVALAPLLVIWLGFGTQPIVAITFLTSFFPVLINSMVGMSNVPTELLELVSTMTKSRLKEFLKVRLPWSAPYIFAGLETAITLAVIGAVVGEFIAGQGGLGYLILTGENNLKTPLIFGSLTLLVGLALVLFLSLIVLERVLLPWRRRGLELK